ncbi:cholinesterase-like [Ylistrum balloti]|uniref:cholinesterase-like n=1 Tax=Ylistrum balloti TaxID=509963 RepID=UPI002905A832|nr:cholinesterase-like [Ylistrum balloti]
MDFIVLVCSLLAFTSISWTSVLVEPVQDEISELALPMQQESLSEEQENYPEVETLNGRIQGLTETVDGTEVQMYLGIPFAAPPVGDLRFKRPVAAPSWTETLRVKSISASCPQIPYNVFPGNPGEAMWNPKTELNEDCLYLNIWTPSSMGTSEAKTLTTMIWIYGGGFYSGSTSLDVYNGKFLAAKQNVIVVSMNYRLGPLGFLYLGEDDAPGNVGLLDQNLAIKWVYDNIEKFGGDRRKISLFGESAGAASVHYHTLSQKSLGYFSSAILQSGSALAPWAFISPEEANSTARAFAKLMNCDGENVTYITGCLRGKATDGLIEAQFSLPSNLSFLGVAFAPTVDDYFLTTSPSILLRQNKQTIHMLMGVNKNEYSYFLNYGLAGDPDLVAEKLTNDQFISVLPHKKDNLTRESIIQQYDVDFTSRKTPYINILDDIGGDYIFKCPTLEVAETLAHKNTVTPSTPGIYVYSFEHRTSSNPWPRWTGVLHADEIEYLFGMPLKECANYTDDELVLSERMMEYWATFAKTGNPNPMNTDLGVTVSEWPEYRPGEDRYIVLDCGHFIKTGSHNRRRECRFWSHLYPRLQQADQRCDNK